MQVRSIFLALLLFAAGFGLGYYVGRNPALSKSFSLRSQQSGSWRAELKISGSVQLPTDSPILKCSLSKPAEYNLGFVTVTHKNLTDRSFIVNYAIFGYDGKGRRVSEGVDEFVIGRHESVLRKVFLESHSASFKPDADMFVIQVLPGD